MTNRKPTTFDAQGRIEKAAPLRLTTMDEVRREMGRVYRDMRSGKIETQDGTRLVYVLGELIKASKAVTEQGGGGLAALQIKGFEVVSNVASDSRVSDEGGESDAL